MCRLTGQQGDGADTDFIDHASVAAFLEEARFFFPIRIQGHCLHDGARLSAASASQVLHPVVGERNLEKELTSWFENPRHLSNGVERLVLLATYSIEKS